MDLAGCDEIGCRQDGLITRRQALKVLSEDQIDGLLTRRIWHTLYPSVYRMTGIAPTWMRRVRGATLARTSDLVASHRSAAYLWGLIDQAPPHVEILVAMNLSARLPGVTVHRTRKWHEKIPDQVNGIPVTSPARTILDLTSCVSKKTLWRAVDAGITNRVLHLDDVAEEIGRVGTAGRPHFRMLFAILAKRDAQFERTESVGEINVLEWILAAGLPRPVEQFRIPIAEDDTFRPDYAYPDLKIAIEVQSWRWHGGPGQYERDANKSIRAAALGWVTLPILPRHDNKPAFIQALSQILASRVQQIANSPG